MILTDKAREDFLVWYFNNYLKNAYLNIKNIGSFFETLHDTFKDALIIDWFDSLCASKLGGHNMSDYLYEYLKRHNYKESIKLTIKRLNEIYNESKN